MKTTYKISTLIASLVLMLAINMNASSLFPRFTEESYIDDIPFDTELISEQLSLSEFDFEEEAFINDIPMEFLCVTVDCKYEKAIAIDFEMEEELYVNDVPFDTEKVANDFLIESSRNLIFSMDEEVYIDDIPFNTNLVASIAAKSNQDKLYVSE